MKYVLILSLLLMSLFYRDTGITQITDNDYIDTHPVLLEDSKNRLWIMWTSQRDHNWDVYYKIRENGEWGDEERLTTDPYSDFQPCMIEDPQGIIWVFWSSNREGIAHIFCKRFDGQTWSEEEQLTFTLWNNDPAAVIDKNGHILLAWIKEYSIWYKVYDGTWGDEYQISYQWADDWDPELGLDASGRIWLTWTAYGMIPYEIYTGEWTDKPPVLSDRTVRSYGPAMAIKGDTVVVFWFVEDGIVYRQFNGEWQPIETFEIDQEDVEYPAIYYGADEALYLAWCGSDGVHAKTKEIYLIALKERGSTKIDNR
jgi:hypothetical protein